MELPRPTGPPDPGWSEWASLPQLFWGRKVSSSRTRARHSSSFSAAKWATPEVADSNNPNQFSVGNNRQTTDLPIQHYLRGVFQNDVGSDCNNVGDHRVVHPCFLEMAAMFAQVSFGNYAYELVIAENWKTPETTRVHQLCCVAQQITRCRCNGWFWPSDHQPT